MSGEPSGWGAMLRLAALRLAIPPHRFWAMSLKEWRALTAPPPGLTSMGAAPMGRDAFEALVARFPDEDPTP